MQRLFLSDDELRNQNRECIAARALLIEIAQNGCPEVVLGAAIKFVQITGDAPLKKMAGIIETELRRICAKNGVVVFSIGGNA